MLENSATVLDGEAMLRTLELLDSRSIAVLEGSGRTVLVDSDGVLVDTMLVEGVGVLDTDEEVFDGRSLVDSGVLVDTMLVEGVRVLEVLDGRTLVLLVDGGVLVDTMLVEGVGVLEVFDGRTSVLDT